MEQTTLNKLLNDLNGDFKGFQLIIESDKMSSLIKSELMSVRKVVSDRDVSTLKYSVSRFAIQNLGFKITDDFYYPLIKAIEFEPDKVKKAIALVNSLPEIFLESELLGVILEFLKNHSEGKDFYINILDTLDVIKSAFQSKNIPRSFAMLLIDQFPLDKKMIFLKEDLLSLPQSFTERLMSCGCALYGKEQREWVKELDLYERLENDASFSFLNFSDQAQEARFALESLSKNKNQDIAIFYPEAQGYETLFYIYQKEFFKNQKFYLSDFGKNDFQIGLDSINNDAELFVSKYHKNHSDNKSDLVNLDKEGLFNLESIIKNYFNNDSSEYALSVWSEIITYLGEAYKTSLYDWSEILTHIHHTKIKRNLKLSTNLNLYTYDSSPAFKPKKIIILGWSEEIFERVSQKHLSNRLLLEMESTLGFESYFLYKNQARELFRKEIMYDTSIDKTACFSRINLKGDSKYPGIFKILKDSQKERSDFHRSYVLDENKNKYNELTSYNGSVSASSVSLYNTCPYKFYLEKVLGLKEEQESEYHLLPFEEGRLLHAILENLKNNLEMTFNEFEDSMVKMYTHESDEFSNWREVFAKQKAEKLWNFFDSERNFLKNNEIKVYAVEKKFEFFADIKNKTFSLTKTKDSVKIRGSIDRMDVDVNGNLILYDYKRKSKAAYTVSSYNGADIKPQIFLYYLAAKLGAVGDFENIAGFQFISLESQTREKGFLFKELLKTCSSLIKEKSSLIDQEKFELKLKIFEDKFFQVLNDIFQGDFSAAPQKIDTCKNCHWKGICKNSKTFL